MLWADSFAILGEKKVLKFKIMVKDNASAKWDQIGCNLCCLISTENGLKYIFFSEKIQ